VSDKELSDAVRMEFFDIEIQQLPGASVQLACYDIGQLRANNADLDLIKLVKKSREYLSLLLDNAISRYQIKH